jgi:uncharacterized protein (TIGR03437 family)
MKAARALLAVWFIGSAWAESGGSRLAPSYSAASIVNSASNLTGSFAPNTIVSLYGSELSFITRAIGPDDVRNGLLPTVLLGSGVRVLVNRIPANIYFVSPNQVNLLIPASVPPGPAEVILILDSRSGPAVFIRLEEAAPALFQQAPGIAIATRPDGSLIGPASPARPGDWIILYATGLGQTNPEIRYGEVPRAAARLARMDLLRVHVAGSTLPPEALAYAGVAPGFAGLYQVNLKLPDNLPANPEIRLQLGEHSSPAGVSIALRPD